MMVNSLNGSDRRERPALTGTLGPDYEEPVSGGGSTPKEFVPPSEVREVFSRGISQLSERLTTTAQEHSVEATMARVRLHPSALAKSHRHRTLFDRRRFQVAGVQRPGDILALVTRSSIAGLTELVQGASQSQLAQLSAVAEVSPYDASIVRGTVRSVVTLFDGTLDDGSSLHDRGLQDFEHRGMELRPYGRASNVYTTTQLPPNETLRHMPWLRGIRPIMKFRPTARLGPHPVRAMSLPSNVQPLPVPIVGVVDSGIDASITRLQRLVAARESHIPAEYADLDHGSLVGALAATGGGFTADPSYFPTAVARLLDVQVLGSGDYAGIDEDDLVTQVEDAVQRYGPSAGNPLGEPVVVWNLSMAQESIASEDLFSLIATELDRIAQEHRVIFTVAVGNYRDQPLRG